MNALNSASLPAAGSSPVITFAGRDSQNQHWNVLLATQSRAATATQTAPLPPLHEAAHCLHRGSGTLGVATLSDARSPRRTVGADVETSDASLHDSARCCTGIGQPPTTHR
jgi:hypothetical protein